MRAVVLGLMACLALAASAAADTLIDAKVGFTADRTLTIDGRTYTGKIWTMPGKERHEQQMDADLPPALPPLRACHHKTSRRTDLSCAHTTSTSTGNR